MIVRPRAKTAAVLIAALLAPGATAVAQEGGAADPRLAAAIGAVERELRDQRTARALRLAREALDDLLRDGPAGVEAPAVARLLYYQAVAAADRGLPDTAAWSWSLAQSLDPSLSSENLGRWGAAGTFLAARPVRPPVRDGDVVPDPDDPPPPDRPGGPLNLFLAQGGVTTRLPQEDEAPAPRYPPALRGSGVAGTVLLQVRIDRRGRTHEPAVLESPHPLLALAAAEAVDDWRYRPAQVDGNEVGVYYTVRIDFRAE